MHSQIFGLAIIGLASLAQAQLGTIICETGSSSPYIYDVDQAIAGMRDVVTIEQINDTNVKCTTFSYHESAGLAYCADYGSEVAASDVKAYLQAIRDECGVEGGRLQGQYRLGPSDWQRVQIQPKPY